MQWFYRAFSGWLPSEKPLFPYNGWLKTTLREFQAIIYSVQAVAVQAVAHSHGKKEGALLSPGPK